MAVSAVDICNRALQNLGANFITSLTQDTKEARQCNVAYPRVREAELRKYAWNFAKTRVQMAYSTTTPAFDYAYQYALPSDYGTLHPDFEEYMETTVGAEFAIEGRYLLTDFAGPLKFTYTALVTDTTLFDPLFADAVAAKIAYEICEALTESNTKKQIAAADYDAKIAEARKANAFEKKSREMPDSSWVTARYNSGGGWR